MTICILFLPIDNNELIAQSSPTYDQTVNYLLKNIKGRNMYKGELDAYTRVRGYVVRNIEFDQSGRIEITTNQKNGINDFKIVFNIFDLTSSIDYPDGVRAYKFLVHFKGLNVTSGYGITFATQNDAIKVARALRHYKSLCNESDDLFSNPIVKEKPTLTKSETLKYINDILNKKEIKSGYWRNIKDQRFSESQFQYHNIDTSSDDYSPRRSNKSKYYKKTFYNYDFNAKDIIDIKPEGTITVSSKIQRLIITFSKKVKMTINDKSYYVKYIESPDKYFPEKTKSINRNSIILYFIEYEEGVHQRLIKAMKHLSALAKEEYKKKVSDDPFGN